MPISVSDLAATVELPTWLDPARLEDVGLVAVAVAVVGALAALRLVRRLMLRILVVGLLGLLALGIWVQRGQLGECVDTCTCSLLGQEVRVPAAGHPRCGEA